MSFAKRMVIFFSALMLVSGAGAAPRKVRVNDAAEADAMMARGGRLIADYGAFRFIETDEAAAQNAKPTRAQSADESDVIELNAQRLNTRAATVQALRRPAGNFVGKKLRLLQFAGPVKPEWRAALEQRGARIVSYVPQNAYLIYGDASTLAQVQSWADATDIVQWDGDYADDYKIHPRARLVSKSGLAQTPLTDTFAVQLVDDDVANASTVALIDQLKLEPVKREFRSLNYLNLIVRLPAARVAEIAARPEVISIQPYLEPRKRDERQNQIIAGNITGSSPTGPGYLAWLGGKGFTQAQFTASGFAVDVTDSGLDNGTTSPGHFGLYVAGNPSLASRVIYNRVEGTPNSGSTKQGCDGHGTLNSHIVAGFNDFASGFPHTDASGFRFGLGVCPFVKVGSSVIFDPDNFTSPNYANLQSKAYQDGARISANSWGAPVGGDYNVDSQSYDALVRDAQPTGSTFATAGNQQMVIVFAAGNSGPGAQTIGSPGTGKNVITVGASENVHSHSTANGGNDPNGNDRCITPDAEADNLNDIASFSSRGPCADGRMKPDLVAPGTHVTGGVGQSNLTTNGTGSAIACFTASGVCALPGGGTAGNPNNFFPLGQQFYSTSSGTSHSTPAVAGACALLRQYFINQALQPPSPAMTKAFLMNSTRYLTGVDANDNLWSANQGIGELNLGQALDGSPRILRDQADKFTATGQTRVFSGNISDATKPFRVTLAWTDAPGSTTGNAFNNDLDLTVTVGGNTYKGNVFNGAFSTTGGTADAKNNVETVFLPAGASNTFTVTVTAANINSDGVPNEAPALDQDFALVIYNAVGVPTNTTAGYSVLGEGCLPGNGAVDPGETVTVSFSMQNLGTASTSNLVVALLETNGVSSPSGPQHFGALLAGGPSVSRPFAFTAGGVCGGSITPTFALQDGASSLGNVTQIVPLGALQLQTTARTNAASISITDNAGASPYPSTLTVSNVAGNVQKIAITLRGLTHTYPDDMDILLVAPTGQKLLLMSDAGGGGNINNVSLTFDDAAASSLSDSGQVASGSFKPTAFDSSTDVFPTPAPSDPYGSTLSVFNGLNPNGDWLLYIRDDAGSDTGTLAQGWTLSVTTSNLACCDSTGNFADLGIGGSSPASVGVGSNMTFSLSITNHGPNVTSLATVTNELPANLAFVSATASQGTCSNIGNLVVCALGPMTNGATAAISIVSTVTVGGVWTNLATINSVTTDPISANNLAAAIVAANIAPGISTITNLTTDEDTTIGPINFVIGDAETGAGLLSLQKFSSNTNLLPLANIDLGGSDSNRTVTLTPALDAVGSAMVTLTVSDGFASASNSFLLTVNPVNDAPLLAPVAQQTMIEGEILQVSNVVTDVDSPAELWVFTLLAGPTNATINPTNGIFSWTPDETHGSSTNEITITVADNGVPSLNATQSFLVVVLETNSPPAFEPASNYFVIEGESLVITNIATDSDLPANLLTYHLDTNSAPAGAEINSTNGVFTWTPGESDGPATNYIAVIVQDDGVPSLTATQLVAVIVLETNSAPSLAAIDNFTVVEGETLTFTNAASDPDFPANFLTFSLDTNTAPAGATIDSSSGVFAWTPGESYGSSTNQIEVVVSDSGIPSLTATQTFFVVVLETNSAPTLAAISNFTVIEGETLTFTNVAGDADLPANSLTFSLVAGPTNVNVNPTNGIFTWTPDESQGPGTNEFAVVVADDGQPSLTVTQWFSVVVIETNTAPALMPIPAVLLNRVVLEGETVGYTNAVTDYDLPPNQLTYSLADPPAGAGINPTNGVFTWTPDESQGPGTNQIVMIVSDDGTPSLTATQSFMVVVFEVNQPPLLTAIPDYAIIEGQALSFTNAASDPDLPANALAFSLENAPTNAAIDAMAGIFSWTPDEWQGGTTNIISVIVADDGVPSLTATQTFTVIVLETNHAPVLVSVPDRIVHAGSLVLVTNTATDPDVPANVLTFSLDTGAPATAGIDSGSGVLTWATSDADANTTNSITVRVMDDGLPALSDAKTFLVTVKSRPFIESIMVSNDVVVLTWSAVAGQTYRLQAKQNLNETNWTDLLPDATASGSTATISHALGTDAHRFYRVMLVP